jgi:hypothetical protein
MAGKQDSLSPRWIVGKDMDMNSFIIIRSGLKWGKRKNHHDESYLFAVTTSSQATTVRLVLGRRFLDVNCSQMHH